MPWTQSALHSERLAGPDSGTHKMSLELTLRIHILDSGTHKMSNVEDSYPA